MESDERVPRYVIKVRFRLDPRPSGVSVSPRTFETTLYRAADEPGTDGWMFFRDNLWRGELADPGHFRERTEDALGVPVESVSFSRFETDEDSFAVLKEAIAADLDAFNAESVTAVVSKYLGSSLAVW